MRTALGATPRQDRLHDDLGVRIAPKPHLDHVEGKKNGGDGGRCAAEEAGREEIDREHSKNRPGRDRVKRAREPVDAVAERNRRGKQMGELADDCSAVWILDEETHEPRA